MVKKRHRTHPNTPTRYGLMRADPSPDWNVFKQIFVEHWDGFKRLYPRSDQRYYDSLIDKRLYGLRSRHPR